MTMQHYSIYIVRESSTLLFIQIKIISVVSCWSPNTAKLKEAFETLFNYATMRVHPFYSPSHLFLDWYFISQVVPSHRDLCKHLDAKKENPSALPEAYTISSADRPVGSSENLLRPLTLPNVNQKIRLRLCPPNMYFPFPPGHEAARERLLARRNIVFHAVMHCTATKTPEAILPFAISDDIDVDINHPYWLDGVSRRY